jgi:hypothetical protein
MTPSDIAPIVHSLTSVGKLGKDLMALWQHHQNEKRKEAKQAAKSLHDAASATLRFLGEKGDPEGPDVANQKLSMLWSKASQDVMFLNRDASDLLFLKAQYWSNPAFWKREVNIELDHICDVTREALR